MKYLSKIISFSAVVLLLCAGMLTGCGENDSVIDMGFEYGPPTVTVVGRTSIDFIASGNTPTFTFNARARANIKSISYQVVGEHSDFVVYTRQSNDPMEESIKITFTVRDGITGVKVKVADSQDKVAEASVTIEQVIDPGFYWIDDFNSIDQIVFGEKFTISGLVISPSDVVEFSYVPVINGVAQSKVDIPVGIDKQAVVFGVPKRATPGMEKFLFTVKLENGDQIDEVFTITEVLDGDKPFTPAERNILEGNGVTSFVPNDVLHVKKLVYPLHVGSFADLFYFSNVEELDLTGKSGGYPNTLPETSFTGNGVTLNIGKGPYRPYLRRIEHTDVVPARIAGVSTLGDLLELGQIKKITYLRNSMSRLDTMLTRYAQKGALELVYADEVEWHSEKEVALDYQNLHQGQAGVATFQCGIETVPLAEVPQPAAIMNPGEVFKAVPQRRAATISYTTPSGYMYDFDRYRYLKFSVFLSAQGEKILENHVNGSVGAYRLIWPRIRYAFWGENNNNVFGDGDTWEFRSGDRLDCIIPAAAVNNEWVELTFDFKYAVDKAKAQIHTKAPVPNPSNGHHHYRNICLSLGAEWGPGEVSNALNADVQAANIIYYFADVRLSQTP